MFFTKRRKNYKTWFKLNEAHVPVQVKFEDRLDARASIGPSGLIIRFPATVVEHEIDRFVQKNISWASGWLPEHPDVLNRFIRKAYNKTITVGRYVYTIQVNENEQIVAHTAKRKELHLSIELMANASELAKNKALKTLLSRTIAQHQKPWVVRRVLELNDMHFKRPIKNVFLKYNQSNWGSCSTGFNINLSTRLLFAPNEVIDYVIIHELAHLVEHNHSSRFWAEVARAMPEYEVHELWLKQHGKHCDF
jgi:predicted metal-dependent hydrolase